MSESYLWIGVWETVWYSGRVDCVQYVSSCFQHSAGSINWLVCIYCGYNVMILWDFIERVSLFQNVYTKPTFPCSHPQWIVYVPSWDETDTNMILWFMTWIKESCDCHRWWTHSLQCRGPDFYTKYNMPASSEYWTRAFLLQRANWWRYLMRYNRLYVVYNWTDLSHV